MKLEFEQFLSRYFICMLTTNHVFLSLYFVATFSHSPCPGPGGGVEVNDGTGTEKTVEGGR